MKLITIFAEGWRYEAHSFHLFLGEAIVTLQDVSVLFGLRIDVDAVIGQEPPWIGWTPDMHDITGNRVSRKKFMEWFTETILLEHQSNEQI